MEAMISLRKITDFLDRELNIAAFKDDSHNGLQVENSGRITRICTGVDASMAFFMKAAKLRADMVVCHHGLSWGNSLRRITELNYRRLKFLMENDIALYGCHLPLDAHPRLGNNVRICRALGLKRLRKFGLYHGQMIGFQGSLPKPTPYSSFKKMTHKVLGNTLCALDFGKPIVRTVAVVSGGAADEVAEAGRKGVDVYVSGEPNLQAYHLAEEYNVNAVFAGHYATETFGVKAVTSLLASRFAVRAEFIDMGIRL